MFEELKFTFYNKELKFTFYKRKLFKRIKRNKLYRNYNDFYKHLLILNNYITKYGTFLEKIEFKKQCLKLKQTGKIVKTSQFLQEILKLQLLQEVLPAKLLLEANNKKVIKLSNNQVMQLYRFYNKDLLRSNLVWRLENFDCYIKQCIAFYELNFLYPFIPLLKPINFTISNYLVKSNNKLISNLAEKWRSFPSIKDCFEKTAFQLIYSQYIEFGLKAVENLGEKNFEKIPTKQALEMQYTNYKSNNFIFFIKTILESFKKYPSLKIKIPIVFIVSCLSWHLIYFIFYKTIKFLLLYNE